MITGLLNSMTSMSLEGTTWSKAPFLHWLIHQLIRLFKEILFAVEIWEWMTPDLKKLSFEEKRHGLMLHLMMGIDWAKEETQRKGEKDRGLAKRRGENITVVSGWDEKEEYQVGLCGRTESEFFQSPASPEWDTCLGYQRLGTSRLRGCFLRS